jgi:hypothetical protein
MYEHVRACYFYHLNLTLNIYHERPLLDFVCKQGAGVGRGWLGYLSLTEVSVHVPSRSWSLSHTQTSQLTTPSMA